MRLQPPSTLLVGGAGSGKTSSIITQLLCGIEVFVVVTEPDGVASLLDAAERLKAPVDKLHWAECRPHGAGWMDLEDMLKKVNSMDQKGLSDLKDLGKASFRPAIMRFLETLKNFKCDRTGEAYGDITTWDASRSLNVDSLSGWSNLAWGGTVGYKPTANPGEWGIAQNVIHSMLLKVNNDRNCFFTLTAHEEKEMDEMSGVKKIMVSTIGAKLAPKIPTFFSEVIQCKRTEQGFTWATVSNQMDLKNRALPIGVKLDPDFAPIIAAHRRRVAQATPPTIVQPEEAPPTVQPLPNVLRK